MQKIESLIDHKLHFTTGFASIEWNIWKRVTIYNPRNFFWLNHTTRIRWRIFHGDEKIFAFINLACTRKYSIKDRGFTCTTTAKNSMTRLIQNGECQGNPFWWWSMCSDVNEVSYEGVVEVLWILNQAMFFQNCCRD